MTVYRAGNTILNLDIPADRAQLSRLHDAHVRLLCECVPQPLEMYLARSPAGILVKRMPGTGPSHAPDCPSYEPPPEFSGAARLLGTAIVETPDTGTTILRLDFALSKRGPQSVPPSGPGTAETAKAKASKLSLRALLHYLWEDARFNYWTPKWSGKRNWKVIHSHLSTVALTKTVGGKPLHHALLIPEPFQLDQKDEIAQRRRAHLARIAMHTANGKKLMIVVAEVKEITTSRTAFKVVFKHLPDFHFGMSEELHSSFKRRFATEVGLWNKEPSNHLLVAATFSMTQAGYANIEELTAMATNANWIPIDDGDDEVLIRTLCDAGRTYFKVLRYGLAPTRPTAAAVLTDTQPKPVAMYIIPPDAPDEYRAALQDLVASSDFPAWFWRPDAPTSIQLPPKSGFVGMPFPGIHRDRLKPPHDTRQSSTPFQR